MSQLAPAEVDVEEAYEFLGELGLLGWSVVILPRELAEPPFSQRQTGDDRPLVVTVSGDVDGKPVSLSRPCHRASDVAAELAGAVKALLA